ncbi:MAG: family 10 glycosylhydrolase [Synechococcales cyanobacterium RM1_1_8]|nr:family 10 glycosylhydrolase [Synechococcales cyanobacterium RM1_1_8]
MRPGYVRLWGRSLLCALFALGFLLACLPSNGGFLAAAQAQAVSPEQATTILDQSSPAPSRRSKSAIAAPPVGPSPIDQAATLAPNRTPDLAPALIRANDQSWAPGPKRAVALPTQTAPPAPKPRPKDGEYLPDDFFAELQGDSAPDAWAWDGELARKGARVTSPRDPSRPEIRGVWLTTSDMAVWRDRASLRQAIRELAALNFNTIYPVVWTRGYVTYPSPTAAAAGIPQRSQGIQGQDLLTELIAQAHREQISVIPWFEYGFHGSPRIGRWPWPMAIG